ESERAARSPREAKSTRARDDPVTAQAAWTWLAVLRQRRSAPDGAAAPRVSGSPLGRTSMPVLAAAAHPCAACPGHPGYDVLRGFKSAAPFGKSSCAANRCAAAATQAGASCIRDAGSPELSHSRIPDVACGHPLYAPLSTRPGETAKR